MEKQEMVDIIYKIVGQKWMLYNWRLLEVTSSVMIWDVLDWIKNNPRPALQIFKFWELTRKPIEDQSEECIEFIYNLINA